MPTKYTHLSTEERVAIMVMQLQQLTLLLAIAVLLRHHPSTISEISRHSQLGRYDSAYVASRAQVLRHKPRRQSRLCSGSELLQVIIEMLRIGWSPQKIASRLRLIWPDHPERYVSHETIYLAIYAYPLGELKRQLISYCTKVKASVAREPRVPYVESAILLSSASTCVHQRSLIALFQDTGKAT